MQFGKILCKKLLLVLMLSSLTLPAHAQYGQGFDSEYLLSTARRSADAMREWHKKHGSFPNLDQDINKALKFVYQKITGSALDPSTQITYTGNIHSIENIRFLLDQSITNAPVEQWKTNPPESWTAPPNSTVILTDGKDQFVVWTSVISGGPMRDSNNKCLFIYDNLAPKTDSDDSADTPNSDDGGSQTDK